MDGHLRFHTDSAYSFMEAFLVNNLLYRVTAFQKLFFSDQVSLQDSVVFTLASFVETSIVPIPNSLHLKIAFGFTMATAVMIFYHWEAMLISHLAIKVTTLPFHNMRELLTGSNYK